MRKKCITKAFVTIVFIIFIASSCIYSCAATEKTDPGKYDASAGGLTYAADVVSITGDGFRIKRITSPHWMRGRENMPNYVKDVLETDKDSVACIEFVNGSQMGINKNTKVEIISAAKADDITKRGAVEKVILKSGAIWAKIRGEKKSQFKVQTGKGVLGVKGTEFVAEYNPDREEEKLVVMEGSVEFTPAAGKARLLKPGQEVIYRRGKLFKERMRKVKQIREMLEKKHPKLNPGMQWLLAVFIEKAQRKGTSFKANRKKVKKIIAQIAKLIKKAKEENEKRKSAKRMTRAERRRAWKKKRGEWKKKRKEWRKKPRVSRIGPHNKDVDTYYPEFSWLPLEGAQKYRFIVIRGFEKENRGEPLFYAHKVVDTCRISYPFNARPLKPDHTYLWLVIPMDANNKIVGKPSRLSKFALPGLDSLGVKGLYPAGECRVSTEDLRFEWMLLKNVTGYRFELSLNDDVSEPLISKDCKSNFVVLDEPLKKLKTGKNYYWRITPYFNKSAATHLKGAPTRFRLVKAVDGPV